MHSENFSKHKIRPLTPKPFLQGMLGRESRSPYHSINEDDKLSLRMLTSRVKHQDTCNQRHHYHNQKGRLQKNNIAFWKDFFFYKYTRLTYGILCREDKKRMRKEKRASTIVRTGEIANASQSSEHHPAWQTSWQILKGSDITLSL